VEQGNKENNIDQKPISIAHRVHQVEAVPPALMVPIIDVVILEKLNTHIEKDVPRSLRLLLTKKRKKL
jgi:diacylglycerol kinase